MLERRDTPALVNWTGAGGDQLWENANNWDQNAVPTIVDDVSTMTAHAYARATSDLPMPGVFAVSQMAPISLVIEDLVLLAECSLPGEWEGQVRYVPL